MNEKELVGVTLGTCTIERVIGRGGMAIVFQAQQSRPVRTVAVKVLLPSATENDPEKQQVFLERFRREADTIAKLEHKSILPVYEYAEATVNGQSLAYLVMPYVRGGTLRQSIDDMKYSGQRFDLPTVSSFISQVAEALSYAHSLGVIHRDIKPGNLLFHSDGRLLLSDFGIVRLNTMPSLTLVGSFVGTAEYASPEQVSAGELDSRSDIYSLGIILYELLTGNVPFEGPTPFAIMSKHLHEPLPSLRAQRPDLSPAIEFVVRKALAKNPRDRYQQASELAADLLAAIRPALTGPAGLRLSGDSGGNSDLTVADDSWKPPTGRASGPTTPMPRVVTPTVQPALPVAPTPVIVSQPAQPVSPPASPSPSQPTSGAALQGSPVQIQLHEAAPAAEESGPVKAYRVARRLFVTIVGLVTLLLQFVVLSLVLNHNSQSGADGQSTIALGVLLGNALNLLALAAIGFVGVTRSRDIRGPFNRVCSVMLAALVVSGFFISYGQFTPTNLPLVSYVILLLTNIYAVRQLSKVDVPGEQIEVAPVSWRAAMVGALTGLIPLIIILIFALMVPLPWAAGSSLFMRLVGVLVISFIGAPTPGAMMAAWLTHKMPFPVLVRTSGVAGLLMFIAAYIPVVGIGWLVTAQPLFDPGLGPLILPLLIVGALLGLVGFLRGMLDAWVYHRVMMRRP